MADPTVTFGAADLLALAVADTRWVPQGSTNNDIDDYATKVKADGDASAESAAFNARNEITMPYKWCGDSGLGSEFDTAVGTGIKMGEVRNGFVLTQVQISTTNTDWPDISFTGHQHDANAHADSTIGAKYTMPATVVADLNGTGFGAIDFFGNDSTAIASSSSTYTLGCEHTDAQSANGNHFVGANHLGREEAQVTYTGGDSGITTDSDWIQDNNTETTGNTAFATTALTGHRFVTRD
ncbi:MAG: hypothetical protein ACTSX8_01620 [Alphaproteobacteria bacterium]